MANFLRISAIVIALAVLVIWIALGAHVGWSQTQVPTKQIDPITEIEYTEYEEGFVPGLDFVAAGLLLACFFGAGGWSVARFWKNRPST